MIDIKLKFKPMTDRKMSNGMRLVSSKPLTEKEIAYIKEQIRRIEADESKFIFNDEKHLGKSTCYDFVDDIVYVTKNVFPDRLSGSIHPRDIMSVAAVLAHEYYGHRTYREEYLRDKESGTPYLTTPYWEDECRASITAAKLAPNLSQVEQKDLIMDAIYRADELGHLIEMDDYMKEVVYGYSMDERNISRAITPIKYVRKESTDGDRAVRGGEDDMPSVQYQAQTVRGR